MNKVFEALDSNLQMAYRKAVDADHFLEQQTKTGIGKFVAVFSEDSLFSTSSRRFIPYVQELAEDIQLLKQTPEDLEQKLPKVVQKLELLLKTLIDFKQRT